GASSSVAGQILFQYQEWIRIIGGILIGKIISRDFYEHLSATA
ncbi:hypothetical protein HKBW3S42_01765, partial [Candidatus Hakubella thermalkaliphila]